MQFSTMLNIKKQQILTSEKLKPVNIWHLSATFNKVSDKKFTRLVEAQICSAAFHEIRNYNRKAGRVWIFVM